MANAYLSRTPATASGQNQWTYSVWVKLGSLAQAIKLLLGNTLNGGSNRLEQQIDIEPSGQLCVWAFDNTTGYFFNRFSGLRLRDFSAWYHIVVQFDPDNGTSANRINAWVNNVAVTWSSSADSGAGGSIGSSSYRSINNTFQNFIGAGVQGGNPPVYFSNCYMAEINMVSGLIVAPTAFAYTDANGVWQPKAYTGVYGTNGFYLDFSTVTSAAALGFDKSGNSNNWTVNNFSVATGSTYDPSNDGPTVNYCTLNPLPTQNYTYTNGNLSASSRSTGDASCIGTMGFTSGKWYFEGTITSNTYKGTIGILGTTTGSFADNVFTRIGSDQALGYDFRGYDGQRRNNSIASSYYGSALPDSATVGVAFDLDNNKIFVSVNGTWVASSEPVTGVNPMFTLTAGATYFPSLGDDWGTQTSSWDVNYGQQAFKYTAPTGFNPLSTASLPTPTIVQSNTQFNVLTYAGSASNQTISGLNFQPDLIWFKERTNSPGIDHNLFDSQRNNYGSRLISNSTSAEAASGAIISVNSNGYSLLGGVSTTNDAFGRTYVTWNWKAGGAATTNGDGTITSRVSANPTAGFSIVTWTGNGSNSDQTVGTGLSTPLDLIIPKARTANVGSNSWLVYSSAVPMGQNQCLILDSTSALISTADQGTVNRGATAGQIRLFAGSLSGLANQNFNGNNVQYVAYCFSAVAGYSASGSFTGNGSTAGPYIYTGFRPRFILTKCSSNSTSSTVWTIVDTTRDSYNPVLRELYPNSNSTEFTDSDGMDIYSNGFRPRRNSEYLNFNGWTYIYMAFAESPFKFSRAR